MDIDILLLKFAMNLNNHMSKLIKNDFSKFYKVLKY